MGKKKKNINLLFFRKEQLSQQGERNNSSPVIFSQIQSRVIILN